MSSLRLALKQSLQDAAPPPLTTTTTTTVTNHHGNTSEATIATTNTSAMAITSSTNGSSSGGGGGGAVASSSLLSSSSTMVGGGGISHNNSDHTSTTIRTTTNTTGTGQHRRKENMKLIRRRNDDDENDHLSSSSEENEASLNDLDDHDDDDSDSDDDDDDNDDNRSHHHHNTTKFDRSRMIPSHKMKKMKVKHPDMMTMEPSKKSSSNSSSNDAAAHRIQKQYRKTKKKGTTTTTSTGTANTFTNTTSTTNVTNTMSSHHHHHHHSNPSRTKAMTTGKKNTTSIKLKKKKKQKKVEHPPPPKPSSVHRPNTTEKDYDDDDEEEQEFRMDMSTDHQHDEDDADDDDEDESSTDSTESWTITAPTERVIRHMASLSNALCVQNIVPGLRVKVLFDNPTRKWYGGYIEQIYDTTTTSSTTGTTSTTPQVLRRIKIAYDDGTTEMTHFPDRKPTNQNNHTTTMKNDDDAVENALTTLPWVDTIVMDAVQNGQHMTPAALKMAQQIYTPRSIPLSSTTTATLPVVVSSKGLSQNEPSLKERKPQEDVSMDINIDRPTTSSIKDDDHSHNMENVVTETKMLDETIIQNDDILPNTLHPNEDHQSSLSSSTDVLEIETHPQQQQKEQHQRSDDAVVLLSTIQPTTGIDVMSSRISDHETNELMKMSNTTINNNRTSPFLQPESLSSSQERNDDDDNDVFDEPQRRPMSDGVMDTKKIPSNATSTTTVMMDDSDIRPIGRTDPILTTTTTTNIPTEALTKSPEHTVPPNSRSVEEHPPRTEDDSNANDRTVNMNDTNISNSHVNKIKSEILSVTTVASTPLFHEQHEHVALDQHDTNEKTMLRDPFNDRVGIVETLAEKDDDNIAAVASALHPGEAHELVVTMDNNSLVNLEMAKQHIPPPIIEKMNTTKETDTSLEKATTLVERDEDQTASSDIYLSKHDNHDALQLPVEQNERATPMPIADSNVERSSVQDSNIETDVETKIVGDRSERLMDIATSEMVSTVSDVVVTQAPQQHDNNDAKKVIVDDLKLKQIDINMKDDNDPHEMVAVITTTVQNMIATKTPDAITSPQGDDDTMLKHSIEVENEETIVPDAIQTTITTAAASIPQTGLKSDVVDATNITQKDEFDVNETSVVMNTNTDTMESSKVPSNDVADTTTSINKDTNDATAVVPPVLPVIVDDGPKPERMHEHALLSSGSGKATFHSTITATDTVINDGIPAVTDDNKMVDEPMSNTDELMSESQPPTEAEVTRIAKASETSSAELRIIDDNDQGSVNDLPLPSMPTETIEGEDVGMIVDNHLESKSSTSSLKRPFPIASHNDEPPKKKLTIRIPVHKMKQRPSGTDTSVTTPKSIHIHAGGSKQKTETSMEVSSPSQSAMETSTTGSKKDTIDTSDLSPRQLKKLALKLERKRQKMIANKSSKEGEAETSQTVVADNQPTKSKDTAESSLNHEASDSVLPIKDDTRPSIAPTNDNEVHQTHFESIEANKGVVTKADGAIDSIVPSATTASEENASKKKKKGIRRKVMEGDSDPKSSKENEVELDDSQWVQCDACGKWRIIPTRVVQELPKQWYCRDNVYDPKHSSCDAPEQTDKEVAREKKRRLKKKQRLLKTAEEAAAAAAATTSLSDEPGTRVHQSTSVGENVVERSPLPPRDAVVDIEKTQKQQKRVSSMEESQLPELPLTTAESRPPKKEKKLASTLKKGRSVESMDKLAPPSEEVVGVVTDSVKPRGRGRPRRANNTTGGTINTNTTKESIPIVGSTASVPTAAAATTTTTTTAAVAADDGENLEWVQCEKCDKWRKLPPHVSADDLPDVWTCNMNTWNPSSASCDAPEDKSDGLQDIGVFGTNGSAAGKLTYRHLIFGSNGRKANRPISEKTCAAESIFSAHFDEDVAPTKVLYSDSSAYISRGRPNISIDDTDGLSVFELMSHSKLWQELRGISSSSQSPPPSLSTSQPGNQTPNTTIFNNNNDTLRMNAYTYDTLPTEVQGPMKECVIRALENDTLSGDEVVQRIQQQQFLVANGTASVIDEMIRPYCTTTVIVTTLCDLVKIGTVECIPKIGPSATTDCWNPHYRRKVQRVTPIHEHHQQQQEPQQQYTIVTSESQEMLQQRRRLSFPMKLSKPWKHAKM